MFDSGFLEMMVIAVIALLVIGPERLPDVARKVGAWVGKARAFVNSTKADIEKELRAEEMKSMLSRQEKEISDLRDMMQDAKQQVQHEVEALDESVAKATDATQSSTTDTATATEAEALLLQENKKNTNVSSKDSSNVK